MNTPSQGLLFGDYSDQEIVSALSLDEKTERAIRLLRDHQPTVPYWLAFSGGKDSCVCDALAKMSGITFDKHYNNTTIDPPELVRFIKAHHPDAKWNNPVHGNMFYRIATRPGLPPMRIGRWCCDEYKENQGGASVKIFGVRAAESAARAHRWREVSLDKGAYCAICPIVHWSNDDVWAFIHQHNIPYCSLYDEGWRRLGCVGCFLNPESRSKEFERWPKYAEKWKAAVIANWQNHQGKLRRDGEPYFHSKFATGEEFWLWWLNERKPDMFREDCQSGVLWTNEDA